MSSKLTLVNPYLRDPAVRERAVFTSVSSSSAIEGIHAPFRRMETLVTETSAASPARTELLVKNRFNRAKP